MSSMNMWEVSSLVDSPEIHWFKLTFYTIFFCVHLYCNSTKQDAHVHVHIQCICLYKIECLDPCTHILFYPSGSESTIASGSSFTHAAVVCKGSRYMQ